MLNKTIWLLWLQGWDSAPWIIKQVAEAWEINNPEWRIVYISKDNLKEYVSDVDYIYDDRKQIRPQHMADIIRLSLLNHHGGVWADATMLCMQPLGTWLDDAVRPAGLWMYHGHGGEMSAMNGPTIWFIAAERDSLMIRKWKHACDAYWINRNYTNEYFWLDGLFRELFESDASFRDKWSLVPHLYCEQKTQAHALRSSMTSSNRAFRKIFSERPPYALKLWWRQWERNFPNLDSIDCKKSNGYFAIQMSKKRMVYQHKMASKQSLETKIRVFFWDIRYFSLLRFRSVAGATRRQIRKIFLRTAQN
jgi:hypothetical protein